MPFEQLLSGRRQLAADIARTPWLVWYSPAEVSLRRVVERHIESHASGDSLDAGAGEAPYRGLLLRHSDSYTALDTQNGSHIDLVGDVMDMSAISDSAFDFVLCTEVLEHVPKPWVAMSELARVLRPGGSVVITVPHLSRIHEAPNDYFRYTQYGLVALADMAGLTVASQEGAGSIFSLFAHQVASVLTPPVWTVPWLRWVAFWTAACLVTAPALLLDTILPGRSLLPLNVVVVCQKPR